MGSRHSCDWHDILHSGDRRFFGFLDIQDAKVKPWFQGLANGSMWTFCLAPNDRESGESITIGLTAGTVPSDEQAEELRVQLAEALRQHEVIEQLSPEEKKAMEEAANTTRPRRV